MRRFGNLMPSEPPGPSDELESIFNEIESALTLRMHYLAIVLALTLPDICAALSSPDGRTNGTKYALWFDTFAASSFPHLTGAVCYSLRCGVVHQGKAAVATGKSPKPMRVAFTLPHPDGHVLSNARIENPQEVWLQFDAEIFCDDMILAARRWYAAESASPDVRKNMPSLFRYHWGGMPPIAIGMDIIA